MASFTTSDSQETCYNCNSQNNYFCIACVCQHKLCMNCLLDGDVVKMCSVCGTQPEAIRCMNENNGCSVVFQRENIYLLEDHLKICPYKRLVCPNNCQLPVLNHNLIKHVSSECPNRSVECDHCKNVICISTMEKHRRVCSYFPEKCEFCSKEMLRKEMAAHQNDCQYVVHTCELLAFGCKFKGTKTEIQNHMLLNAHTKLIAEYAMKSEETLASLCKEVSRLKDEVESLKIGKKESEDKLEKLQNSVIIAEKEIFNLKETLLVTKSEVNALKIELGILKQEVSSVKDCVNDVEVQNSDSKEFVDILEEKDSIETNSLLAYIDQNYVGLMCDEKKIARVKAQSNSKVRALLLCFDMFRQSIDVLKCVQEFSPGVPNEEVLYRFSASTYKYSRPYDAKIFRQLLRATHATVVWFQQMFSIRYLLYHATVRLTFAVTCGKLRIYARALNAKSTINLKLEIGGDGPLIKFEGRIEHGHRSPENGSNLVLFAEIPVSDLEKRCYATGFLYSLNFQ